jgi:hypothetical protein
MDLRRESAVRVVAVWQVVGGLRKMGCGTADRRRSARWGAQSAARAVKSVLRLGWDAGANFRDGVESSLVLALNCLEVTAAQQRKRGGPWQSMQSRGLVSACGQ